jgi:2-hydroxycyclohexanecarboxyl-CoA dehydrogenase
VRLRDRVAIVTGGASGIGRAIALAMGREGARVAVLDLNEAGAAAVAAEIGAGGGEARSWPVDISDPARVEAVVAEVLGRWSTVHVLVNCAGWDQPRPFVETTPDFWDRILAINLKGPIACTRAVLPAMIKQQYGKIVSIASDAGRVGSCARARPTRRCSSGSSPPSAPSWPRASRG